MHEAFRIQISGAVQGVGFRPFVYHLAKELHLTGRINNSLQGVLIEVEGERKKLETFLLRLQNEKPSLSSIYSLEYFVHDATGYEEFEIIESDNSGERTTFVLPDIALCKDCLIELFDENDRRYHYPFINCTNCGPRYSIVNSLPYDRVNTSMSSFTMCSDCEREYNNPDDRRFHAQPIACPKCGPHIELWDPSGEILSSDNEALVQAAQAIRGGKIIALKGIGGFQLMVDANNETAIQLLRERKHRHEKPFALMFPSLSSVKDECHVSPLEERLLLSPSAPVVLLKRLDDGKKDKHGLANSVAPANPYYGVMLPYSPLHHLLLHELGFPLVATSGNFSNEPICIDETEALNRLKNIADVFLVHNRPIVRQVDDSVARVILGGEQVLRRARGYAPLPFRLKESIPPSLAVGAHLKNSVAIASGKELFISQHIGDLETMEAYSAFKRVIADFKQLFDISPEFIACDLHPGYISSQYAVKSGTPITAVQHHHAHVISCMVDNDLEYPALGVCWDGTGLGTDGSIWGGEFLLTGENSCERVGHFRTFPLPGGDAAIKNPARTSLGLLYEIFGNETFHRADLIPVKHFSEKDISLFQSMLNNSLNTPFTSSAGRLFDAIAALIGLRQSVSFEGQAAMELEFIIRTGINNTYSFNIKEGKHYIIDWEPMIMEIIDDIQNKEDKGAMAAKFHNTLAGIIAAMAEKIGEPRIVLTGGCFQNKYLTEITVALLREKGFQPYWHQRIPPNDGGISAGQLVLAAKARQEIISSHHLTTV